MSVYKDRCLVVNRKQQKARFLVEGRDLSNKQQKQDSNNIGYMAPKPTFMLDTSKNLQQIILVENEYVVAVYDTLVTIYNAATGDILQDTAKIDRSNSA